MFEIDPEVAQGGNEKVQDGRKLVAQSDREKPRRHDNAFHFFWRLGIGKFQAGDGNHYFARGQQNVGQELPGDARFRSLVDLDLNPPNDRKRGRNQKQAEAYFSQRGEGENTMDSRIDKIVKKRNQRQNQEWICHLDLSWQKRQPKKLKIQISGLQRPFASGALIPKRPEDCAE